MAKPWSSQRRMSAYFSCTVKKKAEGQRKGKREGEEEKKGES